MLLKIFSIYDPGPSMQENYFYLSLQLKFLDLMDFTAQNYTKHIKKNRTKFYWLI